MLSWSYLSLTLAFVTCITRPGTTLRAEPMAFLHLDSGLQGLLGGGVLPQDLILHALFVQPTKCFCLYYGLFVNTWHVFCGWLCARFLFARVFLFGHLRAFVGKRRCPSVHLADYLWICLRLCSFVRRISTSTHGPEVTLLTHCVACEVVALRAFASRTSLLTGKVPGTCQ